MDERVARYLDHVRFEKRLAERTSTLYALDLQKLSELALTAKVDLAQVQTMHVRRWVAQMHSGGRSGRGARARRGDGRGGRRQRGGAECRGARGVRHACLHWGRR